MKFADDSDESLMARFARGDAAAFEALYTRHEMRIWRYLNRHVGNRDSANELMQEVWFGVARDAGRYQPSARFTTWLFTLAHNRMVDWFRSRRPLESLDSLGYDAAEVTRNNATLSQSEPFAQTLASEQRAALNDALQQLPAEQREVFVLQIEGDMSVEEIAGITGSSFETAKSRLRYARIKLRELLKDYA
jgi:RNA polymerase sigma factor (sigma-70 family)